MVQMAPATVALILGFLGLAVFYWLRRQRKTRLDQAPTHLIPGIPGVAPSSPVLGNLGEIGDAGSLHAFLMKLHQTHGSTVSFYWGKSRVVSLADVTRWKSILKLFDRPFELFSLVLPLIGRRSIQFANGSEGKERRALYNRAFSHKSNMQYISAFNSIADSLAKKFAEPRSFNLHEEMLDLSLVAILKTNFGLDDDDENNLGRIAGIRDNYQICWDEMTAQLGSGPPAAGSEREIKFNDALAHLHGEVRKFLTSASLLDKGEGVPSPISSHMEEERDDQDSHSFIQLLSRSNFDTEVLLNDAITFIVGGFHTTGNFLTWFFYYLALHPAIQEKVHDEIKKIAPAGFVTETTLPLLKYQRAVLEETLRCSALGNYAARYSADEVEIAPGVVVPAMTPILIPLSVVLEDPLLWPEPHKFDPSRFEKKLSHDQETAFRPFGFAGKRPCPAAQFSYVEAQCAATRVLSSFRVVVDEALTDVSKVHRDFGFVTKVSADVFVKFLPLSTE